MEMKVMTCNACNRKFEEDAELKLHYHSEWHRYNLKRKVAGVPGVTETLFQARQLALAEEQDKVNKTPNLYCSALCGREYRSFKGHSQHLKSRVHTMKHPEFELHSKAFMDNFNKIRNLHLKKLLAARKAGNAGSGASATRSTKDVAPGSSGSRKRSASPVETLHSAKRAALDRSAGDQPDHPASSADLKQAADLQAAARSTIPPLSDLAGTQRASSSTLPPIVEVSEECADSSPADLGVTQRPGKEPAVASSRAGDEVITPLSSREPADYQTNLDELNSTLLGYFDDEPEAMIARIERFEVKMDRLVGFLTGHFPGLPSVLACCAEEVVQQPPLADVPAPHHVFVPSAVPPVTSQPAPILPAAPPAVDDLLVRSMQGLGAALLGAQSAALDGVRRDILGAVASMEQIRAEIARTWQAGDERDNEARVHEMVQAGCFVWSGGALEFLQSFVGPLRASRLEAELAPKLPDQ